MIKKVNVFGDEQGRILKKDWKEIVRGRGRVCCVDMYQYGQVRDEFIETVFVGTEKECDEFIGDNYLTSVVIDEYEINDITGEDFDYSGFEEVC